MVAKVVLKQGEGALYKKKIAFVRGKSRSRTVLHLQVKNEHKLKKIEKLALAI